MALSCGKIQLQRASKTRIFKFSWRRGLGTDLLEEAIRNLESNPDAVVGSVQEAACRIGRVTMISVLLPFV